MSLPASLGGLQSHKSNTRLEQIAHLRSSGIGNHIDLPQLVVCGDQSAGKSSVLEGITGIPFPRQDGLCTRFATEIILMHSDDPLNIQAEIIPSDIRDDESAQSLCNFHRTLSDFTELAAIIAEASKLMGLRGDDTNGPTFGHDVLRIKVQGPIGLHLTVVDLPGLISVPDEAGQEEDVQTVNDLVDSYLRNPRTIILAVIQASNDAANQGIIRKSKKFDPTGHRTVGIITKPDLINPGTEPRIAALAKNQDTTRLSLGFFILKNPAPNDADPTDLVRREHTEREYFNASPWKEQQLDRDRTGIVSLRSFLQNLLDEHNERELPKVKNEISSLIQNVRSQLASLGEARPTPSHVRMFLSRLAMQIHALTTAALHGDYHTVDAKFFMYDEDDRQCVRLRACIHNMNTEFSSDLRLYGMAYKVGNGWKRATALRLGVPSANADGELEVNDEECEENEAVAEADQISNAEPDVIIRPECVTESQMKEWILKVYRRTRGRELPGNYNHVLLMELFQQQSKSWKHFAITHVKLVARTLKRFMQEIISYLIQEEHINRRMKDRAEMILDKNLEAARDELDKICLDKDRQPITYNHYYTDNVQKSRHDTTRSLIKKALAEVTDQDFGKKLHVSNTVVDAEKLLNALQSRVLIDMDEQACSEARAGLDAYYKVARKTFVDNVAIQVVERHLLHGLRNVFSPDHVAGLPEDALDELGGEKESTKAKRKELESFLARMEASLISLREG